MRKLAILYALFLMTLIARGQNDPKAISILDKFSSTVSAA
ncbi:MAG: hypothetical protein H6Q23_2437, partial [Bacteroidetes bacterium]|nr:hypothetical protein [Bacteroidota bacterium]